jgi:hypothetical protein
MLTRLLTHVTPNQSLLFIQRRLIAIGEQMSEIKRVLAEFIFNLTPTKQRRLLQKWKVLLEQQDSVNEKRLSLFTAVNTQLSLLEIAPSLNANPAVNQTKKITALSGSHANIETKNAPLFNPNHLSNTHDIATDSQSKEELALASIPAAVQTNLLLKIKSSVAPQSEEYYLHNAGLVILWPFLTSFFQTLGLLNSENKFMQLDGIHHAVVLLHYLINEEDHPPEYQLILNKILVGLEVESVFEAGIDISNQEQHECQQLLTAVIEHASILNNMSIKGFQGSFLLRQGILRQRDGLWLLQVERQSYDLVLDRFPWRFNTIKLPWMSKLLQVEW